MLFFFPVLATSKLSAFTLPSMKFLRDNIINSNSVKSSSSIHISCCKFVVGCFFKFIEKEENRWVDEWVAAKTSTARSFAASVFHKCHKQFIVFFCSSEKSIFGTTVQVYRSPFNRISQLESVPGTWISRKIYFSWIFRFNRSPRPHRKARPRWLPRHSRHQFMED